MRKDSGERRNDRYGFTSLEIQGCGDLSPTELEELVSTSQLKGEHCGVGRLKTRAKTTDVRGDAGRYVYQR